MRNLRSFADPGPGRHRPTLENLMSLVLEMSPASRRYIHAIQAGDRHTSGHSSRVSRYALSIAEKLAFDSKQKHELYLAAMLHDIGKIGIPDELLNCKEKLSEDQMRRIRTHVRLGASMLESIGGMSRIVPVILHHHEAWNGSGYPDRLAGEKIPLMSRILAVADAYDAMTSDRPYRRALSVAETIEEIKRYSGITFDARVVDAFLDVLQEQKVSLPELEPALAV